MTQTLSKNIIADFNTQLAVKMAVGATTGTLVSATDDDGVALPTGTYFLTLDKGNSKKEYIKCTLTGTALTSIQSISRQGALTSGCAREHRVGANVIISDFAGLSKINDLLTGVTSFDAGTPLGYDGTASITTDNQFATKKYVNDEDNAIDTVIATLDAQNVKITGNQTVAGVKTFSSSPIAPTPTNSTEVANKSYVDGVAIAGSPDSSTTVKGIGRVSVAPVSATTPIFVGDNDPRIPTQDEKDALDGTGTPSGSNKYVTADTLDAINDAINKFGDGSDGDVTISSPTTLTRDMYYNNLVVSSTLTTSGYKIFVAGTISGTGTIDWGTPNNGSAGSPGNSGSAGGGGSGGASSGNGQFVSTAGSDGGSGSTGTNGVAGTAGVARTSCIGGNGSAGGGGQGTSGGTGGGGGAAGAASVQTKVGVFSNLTVFGIDFKKDGTFIPYQAAGGSGGGGGGANNFSGANAGGGGGAGASGGIVFIMAKIWAGTFTIKSVGGNGGAGGAAYAGGAAGGGGGGGGRGGSSIVVYGTKTWTGSYNLAGGSAGAGGATSGSAGAAGGTGTSYEIASLTR